MNPAELTIREWVSRNCDPDPYSPMETLRRAEMERDRAIDKFSRAIDQFIRSMTNEPR